MSTGGEVERALLSAMLQDFEQLECHHAFNTLNEDDFEYPGHALLFTLTRNMAQSGGRVTTVSLNETIRQSGQSGLCPPDYLQDIYQLREHPSMIERYAYIVRNNSMMRGLDQLGSQIQQSVQTYESAEEALSFSQAKLIDLVNRGGVQTPFYAMEAVADEVIHLIDQARTNPSDVVGTPSGFTAFDQYTLGLKPEDLIYIGARPSMGKTSFLLNMVTHAALNENVPSILFSMEMNRKDITKRLYASVANVDLTKIIKGNLSDMEWNLIKAAHERLRAAPLIINDDSAMTPGRMKLICQQAVLKYGQLGIIGIDYLQLMHPDKQIGKGDNQNMNVSDISKKLKQMARDLESTVICLSQLNRAVEQRQDKRPTLSDLRDSGSIEQDADVVGFIYRDDYYNKDTEKPGIAEVIIAKNRNGQTRTIDLNWDAKRTRFRNLQLPQTAHELPPL